VLDWLQLDKAFHALAHPWRRWMLGCLLDREASVQEFAATLPISLTAVGKHVKLLEEYGLIRTRKEGRNRICSIEPDALFAAERWLRSAMWARYRPRLGSLPEDLESLRHR
jgi:DNA-binding transcriptional ArsR family regulator